jgi:hypothetical protein
MALEQHRFRSSCACISEDAIWCCHFQQIHTESSSGNGFTVIPAEVLEAQEDEHVACSIANQQRFRLHVSFSTQPYRAMLRASYDLTVHPQHVANQAQRRKLTSRPLVDFVEASKYARVEWFVKSLRYNTLASL